MNIERKEWSEGEFIEIHDPDIEDNPAAVLPSEDAEELAKLILKEDLRESVEEWREGKPEDSYRRAIWDKRNRQRLECADELEAVLEE